MSERKRQRERGKERERERERDGKWSGWTYRLQQKYNDSVHDV